jgi:hypothetical protein
MTDQIYINTINGRFISIKGPQPGTPYYRKRVALLLKAGFKLSVITPDTNVISTLSIKEIEQAVDMAADMLIRGNIDYSVLVDDKVSQNEIEHREDYEVRRMKKLAHFNNQRALAILRQMNDPYFIKSHI